MKSVLISIQPYWVFLIIAKTMGWNISEEKTVEVRKTFPKDENWDEVVKMYCSKDKESFAKIPKEYQPLMKQFLGKVIGEFVCDEITYLGNVSTDPWRALMGDVHEWHKKLVTKYACLTEEELLKYGGKYAWHISNLVIYDKPKILSQFLHHCKHIVDIEYCINCKNLSYNDLGGICCDRRITRPPQSWCYVESVSEQK